MTRTARLDKAGDKPLVVNDDIPSTKTATSRKFWGVKERAYRVTNPEGFAISEGDTVEIFLPPGRTIWSAATTFLLPLALFPVGYLLTGSIIPGTASSAASPSATSPASVDEGIAFLVGFGFLLLGIPLGYLFRKIAGGLTAIPQITKVLTPTEALSCKLKAKAEGCGSCKACG